MIGMIERYIYIYIMDNGRGHERREDNCNSLLRNDFLGMFSTHTYY